jgi:hypothetical protein
MGRVDCFSRYPNRIERSDDREVQKKKSNLMILREYGTDPSAASLET